MNNLEARFLRLKRFSEEEVAALHHAETTADAAWRERLNAPGDRGPGWLVLGAQKMVELEVGKPSFWSPKHVEDERGRAINAFVKSPPVRRAFAMLEDPDKTEVASMHAADWVVWKLAPSVGEMVGDDMRNKEAAYA